MKRRARRDVEAMPPDGAELSDAARARGAEKKSARVMLIVCLAQPVLLMSRAPHAYFYIRTCHAAHATYAGRRH
jgi:hypothetical protein